MKYFVNSFDAKGESRGSVQVDNLEAAIKMGEEAVLNEGERIVVWDPQQKRNRLNRSAIFDYRRTYHHEYGGYVFQPEIGPLPMMAFVEPFVEEKEAKAYVEGAKRMWKAMAKKPA